MSTQSLSAFVEKLTTDDALGTQVAQAISGHSGIAAAAAVAEVGAGNGFDFTAEEALSLYRSATSKPVSEEELEAVAGGAGNPLQPSSSFIWTGDTTQPVKPDIFKNW